MTNPALNDELVSALSDELDRAPAFEITLHPAQLLQLVTMLQLALQHPDIEGDTGPPIAWVRHFIAKSRDSFVGFPTVQRVINNNIGGWDVANIRPC